MVAQKNSYTTFITEVSISDLLSTGTFIDH